MSYQGKYSHGRRRRSGSKAVTLLLALVLLTGAVSGTLAWLSTNTGGITNTFTAARVPNTPDEDFENNVKTRIEVGIDKTDDAVPAYVRVKLVTYRVDVDGNHIGGEATVPNFKLGTDWFLMDDGYYYYRWPVQPGDHTSNLLADKEKIELQEYTDADGGKQVIEVISESIQSQPPEVVKKIWKVGVEESGRLIEEVN